MPIHSERSQSQREHDDGSLHRGAEHKLSLLSHGVYEKPRLILAECVCVRVHVCEWPVCVCVWTKSQCQSVCVEACAGFH